MLSICEEVRYCKLQDYYLFIEISTGIFDWLSINLTIGTFAVVINLTLSIPSSLSILAIFFRTFLGFSPLNCKHKSISPFIRLSPDSKEPKVVNFEPRNLFVSTFVKCFVIPFLRFNKFSEVF